MVYKKDYFPCTIPSVCIFAFVCPQWAQKQLLHMLMADFFCHYLRLFHSYFNVINIKK
jgi:hypothetical protein